MRKMTQETIDKIWELYSNGSLYTEIMEYFDNQYNYAEIKKIILKLKGANNG